MSDGTDTPLSHGSLVARVHGLIDRQRFEQARTMLGEGLAQYPTSAELLYLSAFVDWAQDRLDAAEKTLQSLLGLDPDHQGGRVLLARLLAERKKPGEAEALWIALLRESPEDPDLYAGYGELMLQSLHIDKALRLAEEGLRHEPEHNHCLYVAAMARLIDGKGLGENQPLATLVARHPEHLRAGTTLVIALESSGRPREALRVSQELLRSAPDNPQLLENVRILKASTHWTMLPLYPIQRWGWPAVFGLWALFAFGVPAIAPGLPPGVRTAVTVFWLAYVAYSWIWPPLLRKWI
jgi:tetratricopeptide (TPR) repeat protein